MFALPEMETWRGQQSQSEGSWDAGSCAGLSRWDVTDGSASKSTSSAGQRSASMGGRGIAQMSLIDWLKTPFLPPLPFLWVIYVSGKKGDIFNYNTFLASGLCNERKKKLPVLSEIPWLLDIVCKKSLGIEVGTGRQRRAENTTPDGQTLRQESKGNGCGPQRFPEGTVRLSQMHYLLLENTECTDF